MNTLEVCDYAKKSFVLPVLLSLSLTLSAQKQEMFDYIELNGKKLSGNAWVMPNGITCIVEPSTGNIALYEDGTYKRLERDDRRGKRECLEYDKKKKYRHKIMMSPTKILK